MKTMRLHNHQNRGSLSLTAFRRPTVIEQLEARTLLSASDLDLTFGAGGYAPTLVDTEFTATVVQPDGKIIAVGNTTTGDRDMIIARYNVNGTLDSTFSGDGLAYVDLLDDDYATAVALTPQGKIVVGGRATSTLASRTDFAVARLNVDGTLDTSFSGDGKVTWALNNSIADIALQADGKVLLAGGSVVARLTSTGGIDTSFGGGTGYYSATTVRANAIGILPTGKIVVGGGNFHVFALNSNGTRATDVFTQAPYNLGSPLNDLVVLPDGSVAASGYTYRLYSEGTYSEPNMAVILLDPTGNVKATHVTPVHESRKVDVGSQDVGVSIVYADGRLTATGSSGGSLGSLYVARFHAADLTPDWMQRYEGGYVDPTMAGGVAVDASGRIIVVGSGYNRTILFRLLGDSVDTDQVPLTLQAESGRLTGGTVAATQHAGYTGAGYADLGGNGSAVAFTVSRRAHGLAQLAIRYANGGTANRPMAVSVNGERVTTLAFPPTGGWDKWGTLVTDAFLVGGVNDVQVVATTAAGGPNVDQMVVSPVTITTKIEAEAATLAGGTVAASNHAGYTGSGFADYGNAGSSVAFTVNRTAKGPAVLQFRYANGGTSNRPMEVRVNGYVGTLAFAPTGSWTTWATASIEVPMDRFGNQVVVKALGVGGPNLDSLTIGNSVAIQAEAATLVGVTRDAKHPGYTGTGYADFGVAGSYVEFQIDRAAAGEVVLQLRYANGSGSDRPLSASVNRFGYAQHVSMPSVADSYGAPVSWDRWRIQWVRLQLEAGGNLIRLTSLSEGGPNLDLIVLS